MKFQKWMMLTIAMLALGIFSATANSQTKPKSTTTPPPDSADSSDTTDTTDAARESPTKSSKGKTPPPATDQARESPTKTSTGKKSPPASSDCDDKDSSACAARVAPSMMSDGKNSGHASESLRESPTEPNRPKGQASSSLQVACRSKSAMDDWSTCSAAQIKDINTGISVGRRQHEPLKLVDSVSLASDGSLDCKQTNGKACTADQLKAILEVSASPGGTAVVMKTRDMSSPGMVASPPSSTTDQARESPTLPSRPKGEAASSLQLACHNADGQSECSEAQIHDLNTGLSVGRRQHETLKLVDSVSISSDGMLACKQTDGTACTEDQLKAVQELAQQQSKGIVLTSSYGAHYPTVTLQK